MRVVIVIPARYASKRLPGKPLLEIQGKALIQWVYENARSTSGVSRVIVATDDERIRDCVLSFDGEVLMPEGEFRSGTDRVAALLTEDDAEIFVDLQGDEPMLGPEILESAISMVTKRGFDVGTAMTELQEAEKSDPNVVKVTCDSNGEAKAFSRGFIEGSENFRHLGIYVYPREVLSTVASLPSTESEKAERLEQLRAFEKGYRFGVARVQFDCLGVDTKEDLERVRERLAHG